MAVWKKRLSVSEMNAMGSGTIHEALGLRYTELGEGWLAGTLPVDGRTRQPFGALHGGASVTLAESLGSMAAYLACEEGEVPAGIEVSASHLRAVREGTVTGTARPVNVGKTVQVWSVEITDEAGRAVCLARLTVLIRAAPAPAP